MTIVPDRDQRFGTLVSKSVVGVNHQHVLSFRLDFAVEGENNSFAEMNVEPYTGPGDPRANAFQPWSSIISALAKRVTTSFEKRYSVASCVMDMPPSDQWSVEVVERGRSGTIEYREPAGRISFYWEFGGGDTLAIIWVGDLASWNTRYPWAIDHRRAILERVGREVIRQKASSCRADIDEKGGYIYVR